jgi:broad specificity phosphatase PhoE
MVQGATVTRVFVGSNPTPTAISEKEAMSMIDPSRVLVGWLIRHGELNVENKWDGWGNFVLSPEGQESAEKAGQWLSFQRIGRIVSSDLVRAYQTAEIISNCCNVECPFLSTDPVLRALNVGDYSGKEKTDERKEEFRKYLDNPALVIPGGESRDQLKERVQAISQYFASPYKGLPTAIATHNSTIKAWLDLDERGDFITPGGILEVYLTPEGKFEFEAVLGKVDPEHDMGGGCS